MSEREVVKSFIDFAFIIKSQLHSEKMDLLRSILTIAIMESEDLIEIIDESSRSVINPPRKMASG